MTKEEKIKEAYGEYYFKNSIDENGWTDSISGGFLNTIPCDYRNEMRVYGTTTHLYRPKSLKGIENNNGWKSINDNLPKEKGYYIMYNGENMVLIELNDTTDMITLRDHFLKDGFTHYQPIEKPEPPIY